MKRKKENKEFIKLLEPDLASLSRFSRAIFTNSFDVKDIISEMMLRAYENYCKLREK